MKKFLCYFLISVLFYLVACKKDEADINPIVRDAGADVVNVDKFWVNLNADSLNVGESGEWSVKKGLVDEKVYFENTKSPKTIFYGLPGQKYLLEWKVKINGKYYQDTVHINFNPINVKIRKQGLDAYSTRIRLIIDEPYPGKWSISGNLQRFDPDQLTQHNILVKGTENGTIYAKWTVTYGSVSFSDTIIFKTRNYNEYEALEDLNKQNCYTMENGHVVEINLGSDGNAHKFGRFDEYPALSALKYLRKLNLCGGGVGSFSSSIPLYYKDLIFLDLSCNYINQIPANIGELRKLETLKLNNQDNYNQITQIPESFCNLVNLKYLDLSSNDVSELPSAFGNLNKLEKLLLWGNIIRELPSSFGNLNSLKYLGITGVRNNLPESFGQLTNLEELLIGGTSAVTKLPDNIGNLKKLKFFSYQGDTNIEYLPNSFCELDSMKEFYFRSNLKELPLNFGNLKSLETLNLYANLKELPGSFVNLKTLKYLRIASSKSNNTVFILPQNIEQLSNLEGIAIEHTNFHTVPNSIGRLTKLRELSFWNCSLDSIPPSIGDLKNLRSLNLVENNLSIIPENLKNLKGLYVVNLAGNINLAWQIDQIRKWGICSEVIY